MPYTRLDLTTPARTRLLRLALAEGDTIPVQVPVDEDTAALAAADYLDSPYLADAQALGATAITARIRDEGWRWITAYLESGQWRHADRGAERGDWEAALAALRAHRQVWTRPTAPVWGRGGEAGRHVLPDRAQDRDLRARVDQIYEGALTETRPDWVSPGPAGDRDVLEQLLDHAPDAAETGVGDAGRGLRADEVVLVYGAVPVDRRSWLERADEYAAAWGRPLFGPDGWFGQSLGFFL